MPFALMRLRQVESLAFIGRVAGSMGSHVRSVPAAGRYDLPVLAV